MAAIGWNFTGGGGGGDVDFWNCGAVGSPSRAFAWLLQTGASASTTIITLSTAGSFTVGSDRRLKEDIRELDGEWALKAVDALQGVRHRWKGARDDGGEHFGLIAQDVQKVLPELVREVHDDDDTYLGVAYDRTAPVFVAAIQELHRRVKKLEAA
jgi:hypothetical protein